MEEELTAVGSRACLAGSRHRAIDVARACVGGNKSSERDNSFNVTLLDIGVELLLSV